MEPKHLTRGDACPNCGGAFLAAVVPTAEAFARATDRENPQALPSHADTAPPDQRAEIGALSRCTSCGYLTRFPAEAPAHAAPAGT